MIKFNMKHIKKFESATKELTEEYIREVLLTLEDNGLEYNLIRFGEGNDNFSITFLNNNSYFTIECFDDVNNWIKTTNDTEKLENLTKLYEHIKHIMTTFLLDGYGTIFESSRLMLKVFKFNKLYK